MARELIQPGIRDLALKPVYMRSEGFGTVFRFT